MKLKQKKNALYDIYNVNLNVIFKYHVAMARICVGYRLTEMALIIAAHKPLLTNVTNAIIIAQNCVRKFKANADTADTIIQTADNGNDDNDDNENIHKELQ